jgi:hypothetical protein
VGATALALIGLFNAIGTYVFGLLGARYSQKHLLAIIYLLRTLVIATFLVAPCRQRRRSCSPRRWGLLWLGVRPARHRHHRQDVRASRTSTRCTASRS